MSRAEDLTYRLSQVEEAVEEVLGGRWPARRFEEAVRVWLSAVEEQERTLAQPPVPEEAQPAIPRDSAEMLLGRDGARLYREGLERMLCYVSDRNPQHLREGLEQVREGNERLNHAARLNPASGGILRRLRGGDPSS